MKPDKVSPGIARLNFRILWLVLLKASVENTPGGAVPTAVNLRRNQKVYGLEQAIKKCPVCLGWRVFCGVRFLLCASDLCTNGYCRRKINNVPQKSSFYFICQIRTVFPMPPQAICLPSGDQAIWNQPRRRFACIETVGRVPNGLREARSLE